MKWRGLAFGCLIGGGALALIASPQPWWRGLGDAAAVKLVGNQVTGGLSQALPIVALAGTLLMLVLRTRGRRQVGAVLLVVGVAVGLVGAIAVQPRPDVVRGQLGQVGLQGTVGLTATAWPPIFALAGLMIAGGAALTMITVDSWPVASDRFQPGLGKTTSDESAELWKAMDAGVDPTINTPAAKNTDDHDPSPAADPEMRDRRAGDTMDGTEQAQPLPWSPTSHSTDQVQRGPRERKV
jgi:hypothetical protein